MIDAQQNEQEQGRCNIANELLGKIDTDGFREYWPGYYNRQQLHRHTIWFFIVFPSYRRANNLSTKGI